MLKRHKLVKRNPIHDNTIQYGALGFRLQGALRLRLRRSRPTICGLGNRRILRYLEVASETKPRPRDAIDATS